MGTDTSCCRGSMSMGFLASLIIALLVFIMLSYIVGGQISEKMEDYRNRFTDIGDDISYDKECISLGGDLEKNKVNEFVVDLGDIAVKDIKYFGLFFDWKLIDNKAYVEQWMVSCHDGPDLFDSPWELGKVGENTAVQFTESNGYETEIECDNKVDVTVETGDGLFDGTNLDVKLCFKTDR